MENERRVELALLLVVGAVFLWSAIEPNDRLTWVLETLPVMIAVVLLLATYARFRFTLISYILMTIHAIILMVGGHYTYAEMPLFDWLQDALALSRNHYDRLGHVAQGFIPAIVTREILIRTSPVRRGGWLYFMVISICLAISAFYELIEWWVAAAEGSAATAFLATQGDPWDTQWDMALALGGAIVALAVLARRHDRALRRRGL